MGKNNTCNACKFWVRNDYEEEFMKEYNCMGKCNHENMQSDTDIGVSKQGIWSNHCCCGSLTMHEDFGCILFKSKENGKE